jgi:hypothetical protein
MLLLISANGDSAGLLVELLQYVGLPFVNVGDTWKGVSGTGGCVSNYAVGHIFDLGIDLSQLEEMDGKGHARRCGRAGFASGLIIRQ